MLWGHFDAIGLPVGFYADDVHGPLMRPVFGPVPEPSADDPEPVAPVIGEERNPAIPAGVVEITEPQWREFLANPGGRRWDGAAVVAYAAPAAAAPVPDCSTLSDWRVALILWTRPDGSTRLDEVSAKVAERVASGHPLGRVARERLEYANHVLRAELMQLRPAFGFTEAEVEESLWRADCVRQGDLSGVWPLI